MKKGIITIIIFIFVIFVIFILYAKNNNENGTNSRVNKINNNSDVIKNQIYKNLSITDVSITIDKNNASTYTATVTNMEDVNNIESINIILKDTNGNTVTTLIGFIDPNLKKGEETIISSTVDIDLSNVVSVEYKEGN